jgi:hypothetical protein
VLDRFLDPSSQRRRDRLVLAGLVVLAALFRFVDLPTRGTWDADQGHDMLVLRGLVHDGVIPLLGPPTSIGDFHHGVLYYYLLAPAAALGGSDPLWVVAEIALAGVAAVAVTWWLARSIGGEVAGAVAGVLMAVSASAIDESTFIWNPNLIALSSSVALAAAWRARTSGRARWWVVAAVGVIVTMHCHVLGVILLPPVLGVALVDLRERRTGAGQEARRIRLALAAGLGLVALSYVPLLVHELEFNWSELRAAAEFLAAAGGGGTPLPARFLIVALRVLAWPLTGLITDAPLAALLAAAAVIASLALAWRSPLAVERFAARWFTATLAWTILALTFAAGSLATVIAGLPNDHYHAFADPVVFVSVGLGVAGLTRWRRGARPVGAAAAAVGLAATAAFNVTIWPPTVAADGGRPAADAAAVRVLRTTSSIAPDALVLHSLPDFKPADAVRFPLVRRGAEAPAQFADSIGFDVLPHVVLCDELFADVIAAPCGGPAEDLVGAAYGVAPADRFEAAPGRWISVYLPAP